MRRLTKSALSLMLCCVLLMAFNISGLAVEATEDSLHICEDHPPVVHTQNQELTVENEEDLVCHCGANLAEIMVVSRKVFVGMCSSHSLCQLYNVYQRLWVYCVNPYCMDTGWYVGNEILTGQEHVQGK